MCNNIVRNKLGDKLSVLAAMVEINLSANHDLVYFVRDYSWDNKVCWMDGLIDGDPCVSFIFGEELEGGNGVYLTISHEGGENQTSRIHKLDKSLEEQTDEAIRTIASDICQMVEEYYIKANKLRDNLNMLAHMLKRSLGAKYRRVRVEKLKCKDSPDRCISCSIGNNMLVHIDDFTGIKISESSHRIICNIVTKDGLFMKGYELPGSLDEQDERTICAIADAICQAVSEHFKIEYDRFDE